MLRTTDCVGQARHSSISCFQSPSSVFFIIIAIVVNILNTILIIKVLVRTIESQIGPSQTTIYVAFVVIFIDVIMVVRYKVCF